MSNIIQFTGSTDWSRDKVIDHLERCQMAASVMMPAEGLEHLLMQVLRYIDSGKAPAQPVAPTQPVIPEQNKFRDLSQPVDPQISEYEKALQNEPQNIPENIPAQPVSDPYKLNGWISVDEKMPEDGAPFLCIKMAG